ncbi:hypothetical protein [Streptomyces pacificus]|uniref:hypothetical protein n=1 Tax=Streptomyces pacificus TaxID=2705029 RepID=UPI00156518D7|nr:hypothetical protein [Streptomyces pacificus]
MSRQAQGGLIAAALVLIPLLAILGNDAFRAALDFAAGVLSLVSLTASVAWGLIATDRVFLSTRHRLLAQAIHRSTAVASLGFLLLHATIKISLDHVELLAALVPFSLGITGTSGLIGFGSLAGLLMVVAGSTGAARSALAGNGRFAGRWRALHMLAYPAWCLALVHGLYAGRPADGWVTVMYSLALLGVAAAVSLRLLPLPVKRRIVEQITSLAGAARDVPGAAGQNTRDMASSPLPGASGIPAQPRARFERGFPPGGADLGDPPGRRPGQPLGAPLGSPLGAPLGQPVGAPRGEPRTLAAPSPQLYEATQQLPSTASDLPSGPVSATEPFPGAGPVIGGPLSGDGPGTGISAAYRAVSRAGDASPRTGAPTAPQGRSADDVPYAERIPMTEELPVVPDDPAPRPASWPTPSPPPPAQAFPQPPADSPSNHSNHNAPNGHNSQNDHNEPRGSGNPGDPYLPHGTAEASGYSEPYAAPPGGGFDPAGSFGGTGSFDPAASFGAAGAPGRYDGPPSAEPLQGSSNETRSQPGPLYPPTAGEPWNAPAGERP